MGCFKDVPYDRDLKNLTVNVNLTKEFCFNRCISLGYSYAGLQYS